MKRILLIIVLLVINISHSQVRSETIKSLSSRDFKIHMDTEKNIVFCGVTTSATGIKFGANQSFTPIHVNVYGVK